MRNDRGQMAVGLAVAFTGVLAMFGLVLNSALLARNKLKLQQTADRAALVGADMQRAYLNQVVNEGNKRIDILASALQIAFDLQSSPFTAPCMAMPQMQTLPSASCKVACEKFDDDYFSGKLDTYSLLQQQMVSQVSAAVMGANEHAYNAAVDTVLTPGNLPKDLRWWVTDTFGQGVTRADLHREFLKGSLEDHLQIEANKSVPLFNPKMEVRLFKYLKWKYVPRPPFMNGCMASWFPRFHAPDFKPVKLIRADNYVTSFLIGLTFRPFQKEIFSKFGLFLKDFQTRKEITGSGGEKFGLLSDQQPKELVRPIMAFALAKPYGGQFPTGSDAGADFEGVKLIGIADRQELEGFEYPVLGMIPNFDVLGRRQEDYAFTSKDFLH